MLDYRHCSEHGGKTGLTGEDITRHLKAGCPDRVSRYGSLRPFGNETLERIPQGFIRRTTHADYDRRGNNQAETAKLTKGSGRSVRRERGVMVGSERIELPTRGFSGPCSTD